MAIVASPTSGMSSPVGAIRKGFDRLGVLQQQRTLAEVVEREAGHDDGKPGQPDGFLPKCPMSHSASPPVTQHHRPRMMKVVPGLGPMNISA